MLCIRVVWTVAIVIGGGVRENLLDGCLVCWCHIDRGGVEAPFFLIIFIHVRCIGIDLAAEPNRDENLLCHDFKSFVDWYVHRVATGVSDWQACVLSTITVLPSEYNFLNRSGLQTRPPTHEFEEKLPILIAHPCEHLPEHFESLFFPCFFLLWVSKAELSGGFESSQTDLT